MKKQPQIRQVEIAHHTYQPSRKELQRDHSVNATFDEIVDAVLKPVKICYVKPKARKP